MITSAFNDAYLELMGKEYDHGKKSFTPEELAAEPTIILQLSGDPDRNTPGTPGLVDATDESPYDVLLAIPPEHYYEWDPDEEAYIARFYTDEGNGSVLGANAMMGHEVFFDVDNHVIGWSESNCDYETIVAPFMSDSGGPPATEPIEDTTTSGESEATPVMTDDGVGTDDDFPNEYPSEPKPSTPADMDPNHDDNGSDYYGEATTNTDYDGIYETKHACSTLQCQVSVLFGVVAVTVYCAMRFLKRQRYTLTDSHELELHQAGEFVNGKDHGYNGEFT